MSLADQKCIPCTGTIPPLEEEKIKKLLVELHEDWSLNSLGHLQRSVQLANFNQAMKLANEIAEIALSFGYEFSGEELKAISKERIPGIRIKKQDTSPSYNFGESGN